MSALITLLSDFWTWLGDGAAPLANLIHIGSAVLATIGGTLLVVRHWLGHKDGIIRDLRDDLADRERKLSKTRTELAALERQRDELGARLAETALEETEKEKSQGNKLPQVGLRRYCLGLCVGVIELPRR
jgi:hypothetical protein